MTEGLVDDGLGFIENRKTNTVFKGLQLSSETLRGGGVSPENKRWGGMV